MPYFERVALGPNARRLDRLLHRHAVVDQVHHVLGVRFRLHAATHVAEGHHGLAVLHHEPGGQRVVGPLAGRDAVGVTLAQHEALAAVLQDHARFRCGDARSVERVGEHDPLQPRPLEERGQRAARRVARRLRWHRRSEPEVGEREHDADQPDQRERMDLEGRAAMNMQDNATSIQIAEMGHAHAQAMEAYKPEPNRSTE